MKKRDYAFDKVNFILIAVGMLVVIIGFILMGGASSSESAYNPEIFSWRRIKLAPLLCFVGFVSMIYGVMHKPKSNETE